MNNRLQMIFRWFKYRLKSTMEHDRLKQIWFIIICWISSTVAGIGYSVIAVFIGYLIIQMIRRKAVRYIVLVVLIGGIVVGGVYTLIDKNETEQVVKTLGKDMPENPSKTGPYDVNFISYGSGE